MLRTCVFSGDDESVMRGIFCHPVHERNSASERSLDRTRPLGSLGSEVDEQAHRREAARLSGPRVFFAPAHPFPFSSFLLQAKKRKKGRITVTTKSALPEAARSRLGAGARLMAAIPGWMAVCAAAGAASR